MGAVRQSIKTTAVLETEVMAESRVLITYFIRLDNTEAELEEILQGGGPYGPLGDTLEGENLDAVTSASSGFSAAIDTLGTLLPEASIVEETAPVTEPGRTETSVAAEAPISENGEIQKPSAEDGFIYIKGGTYEMGSPDSEAWRSEDENLHSVSLNDFYLSPMR